ncbi:MAG: Ig-like domain-containing protein [Thermodesulfobacteriota bacterium]
MRIINKISTYLFILLTIMLLASCGGGSGDSVDNTGNISIVGAVQKGPFIVGSTVTISLLSNKGENTDSTIVTNTTDDLGSFSFSTKKKQLVQISSTGYYRNEITGELSTGTLTLRSIYKTTEKTDQFAYINLLTHIISNRVLHLIVNDDISFDQAVTQAESEFLLSFSAVIPNSTEDNFTSLTIFGDSSTQGSSYLLSVSSVLYQFAINESINNSTNPDAELTLLVNQLESDFGNDGVINDASQLTALRAVIPQINPTRIEENILSWAGDISGYSPADINEYLDSDLDGVFNISDNDDDNDGIDDSVDPTPYVPEFVVFNQEVSIDEDVPIFIDISSNNPMGEAISLVITKPPSNGSLLGSYPMLTYTPNSNYSGTDEFKYILSQSSIASEEVTILININSINDHPVISGTPSNEILANNSYSFTPSAIDIENDQLSFTIENIPSWASFDETSGQLSGIPSNEDAGSYGDIIVTVSDGTLAASLDPFYITVLPDHNSLVQATVGSTQTITGGTTAETIVFSNEIFDRENEYNASTGEFTAIKTGYYYVSSSLILSGLDDTPSNQGVYLEAYTNNISFDSGEYSNDIVDGNLLFDLKYSSVVYLNAGDVLDLRTRTHNPETSYSVDMTGSSLSIFKFSDGVTTVQAGLFSNQTITSSSTATTVVFSNEITDTQNEYDVSNGKFTANEAGYYCVSSSLVLSGLDDRPTNQGVYFETYINNISFYAKSYSNDITNGHQLLDLKYSSIVYLDAGDVVDIRTRTINPETSYSVDTTGSSLSIFKLSDGVTAVQAVRSGDQSIVGGTTPNTIVFTFEATDTQNEYDPSTGGFTANEAGYYYVSSAINLFGISDSPNQVVYLEVHINSLVDQSTYSSDIINSHQLPDLKYSTIVYLNAGDVLDVRTRTLYSETSYAAGTTGSSFSVYRL